MGARLLILTAAFLWSTGGAAIKLSALNGWQLAGGRAFFALLTLAALLPETRRTPRGVGWLVALAYAATTVSFVLATTLTTAANAIFIQDCAPLFVLIGSPWLLGERPGRGELRSVPIYVGGLVLFFADRLSTGQMLGNLVALGSGVAFASLIMGMRKLRDDGAMAAVAWGNGLAVLVSLPLAVHGPVPRMTDVGILVFLGVVQLGFAYAVFARGIKHVRAVEASLLLLLEPVLSSVWAALVAHEVPGPWARAGAALILFATVWRTLQASRTSQASRMSEDTACRGSQPV